MRAGAAALAVLALAGVTGIAAMTADAHAAMARSARAATADEAPAAPAAREASAAPAAELAYPAAMRGAHVDVYHGVTVADPYRWMEDIDSPATRQWVKAENTLTRRYLAAIADRPAITRRLKRIWNYERWSPPEHYGRYWLYSHNDGLQNQAVIFVTTDPDSPGRVLLDPNTLSRDGTVALRQTAMSDDGRYFAYALSSAGSDWQTWHVIDVATGKPLPDTLRWSKAGGASWRKDDSGFYYTRYAAPQPGQALEAVNRYQTLDFHKLGTPQSADVVTYVRRDDPDWFVSGQVTDDGRYLVIEANHGDAVQNTLLVQDLSLPGKPLRPIIATPIAVFSFIGNLGKTFYVLTDAHAPRYRIIAIDLAHPARPHWRTVVPQGKETLQAATLVGGQLIAEYLENAHSAVRRYSLKGRLLGTVHLDGMGTAAGFAGHATDTRTYYSYSSFTRPPSVYRLDLASGASTAWRQPSLAGFKPAQFEERQIFYRSKDGTRVPLYIVSRKGTPRDATHPTLLYGYGGFDISLEPAFSASVAAWIEMGGVFAMANLRGGGEYGEAWHRAGMKTHKQNVFDDFIYAAKYLIAHRWTSPRRLAIWGASNGGLLVGVAEEQQPQLFAAAVPQAGVMDMMRFRDFTVGKGWESEYGSIDNPAEFRALLAYSPVQNTHAGVDYPATLITTADHDDRVFPAHSFKFAAAMQHADPHGRPILLRVETRAGHGQGMPTSKRIAETADIFSFVLNAMGLAGAER
ncbi:MAG: prolyl oligopeptidase family serine peptidase [Steroidobacteraceae bacterium]